MKSGNKIVKNKRGQRPYRRYRGYGEFRYGWERPEGEDLVRRSLIRRNNKSTVEHLRKSIEQVDGFYLNVKDGRTYSEVGQKHSHEVRREMTTSQSHRIKSHGDVENRSEHKGIDRNKPEQEGCSSWI